MDAREARRIACAILAIDDLQSIVIAQLEKFDFAPDDKRKIAAAAEDIAQSLFRRAGDAAVERVLQEGRAGFQSLVVGFDPIPAKPQKPARSR